MYSLVLECVLLLFVMIVIETNALHVSQPMHAIKTF